MDKRIIPKLIKYFYPNQSGDINIHRSHISSKCLLILRIFAFIYLSGIYLWNLWLSDSFFSNFVYFTLQSYFTTWLYFTVSLQDYLLNRILSPQTICKKLNMWSQTLFQLSFCNQVVVTLVFWGFLFQILLGMDGITIQIIVLNANLHAGPFILLTIDLFLNPFSFNNRRLLFVFIFGLQYMILNCVYSLNYKIIYKPINWVSPLSYILVGFSFVIGGGVFLLGKLIYTKCKKHKLNIGNTKIEQGLINSGNNDSSYDLDL